MIVVTAPTGQIGGQLVERLLHADEPLRLVVRDRARLPDAVRDRVEVVEGSHGDAATVDEAFAGADALFWLVPVDPKVTSLEAAYIDFSRPARDAVRKHGVAHVVGITAVGRGSRWQDRAGLVTASLRMDDLFAETGAAFRGVAMPSFMDNMLMQLDAIRDRGSFTGAIDGDHKAPTAATRDMAAAAARLLLDRSWTGSGEVAVLGPEDLSMNEMATIMSDVLGKPVRYHQLSFDEYAVQLRERGMSEGFADGYVEMMHAKNEGIDNVPPRTADSSTPTSFRQWCEEVLKPAVQG